MFTTCPSSRNLLSSQGQLIEDFCSEASMELVRRRLDQMNEDDLARQLWIIEGSFATLSTESENMSVTPAVPPTQLQASEVAHAQLMQAACAVGDRLKALALKSGQGVNWLGINMVRETQGKMFWNLQVLKPMALYDGLPGVILFLAYLGEVTGNAMYSDIARSAWVTVQKAVETLLLPDPSALGLPRRLYPLGAFEGSGSYIYLCAHLSILWRDLAYARHAEELLDLVEQDVERDTRLDVANGVAGCIASLLCLYQVASSPRALSIAVRCGDHLLAHAQPLSPGIGWYTLGQQEAAPGFYTAQPELRSVC